MVLMKRREEERDAAAAPLLLGGQTLFFFKMLLWCEVLPHRFPPKKIGTKRASVLSRNLLPTLRNTFIPGSFFFSQRWGGVKLSSITFSVRMDSVLLSIEGPFFKQPEWLFFKKKKNSKLKRSHASHHMLCSFSLPSPYQLSPAQARLRMCKPVFQT